MADESSPGWYPDPDDASRVRWWDGEGWTDRTGERETAPAPAAPTKASAGETAGTPMHRRPLPYVVAAVFLAAFAVGVVVLTSSDEAGAEVILEPTASSGDDPFTDSVATEEVELTGGEVEQVSGGGASVESVDGSAPGLYGGTGEEAVCDAEQMIAFLAENRPEADAFAEVVGTTAKKLPDYISGLTPVLLREDTRVTNHGFTEGVANPFQAVLQAGSAVMVDDRGVPRIRCACGNPLAEPAAAEGSPEFSGERWESFDSGRLAAVAPSEEPIETFELTNVETGEIYEQAAGGGGGLTVKDLLNLEMPAIGLGGLTKLPPAKWKDGVHPDSEIAGAAGSQGASVVGIDLDGTPLQETVPEAVEVQAAVGDLTGDGLDDGVVVRQQLSCGASCVEQYDIVAFDSSGEVLEQIEIDGSPLVDSADVGLVEDLRIKGGGFELTALTFGPSDAQVDGPSIEVPLRFEWNGSEFEQVG